MDPKIEPDSRIRTPKHNANEIATVVTTPVHNSTMAAVESAAKALENATISKTKELKGASTPLRPLRTQRAHSNIETRI